MLLGLPPPFPICFPVCSDLISHIRRKEVIEGSVEGAMGGRRPCFMAQWAGERERVPSRVKDPTQFTGPGWAWIPLGVVLVSFLHTEIKYPKLRT